MESAVNTRPTVACGLLRFASCPTCCARAKTSVVHVLRSRRKIGQNSRAAKRANRTVRGPTRTFSSIGSNGYLRVNRFGFFRPVESRIIACSNDKRTGNTSENSIGCRYFTVCVTISESREVLYLCNKIDIKIKYCMRL